MSPRAKTPHCPYEAPTKETEPIPSLLTRSVKLAPPSRTTGPKPPTPRTYKDANKGETNAAESASGEEPPPGTTHQVQVPGFLPFTPSNVLKVRFTEAAIPGSRKLV